MIELIRAKDMNVSVEDLYEEVNERLSLHMIDNEVYSVYIAIFTGNMFFRFRKDYNISSIMDEVSGDLCAYFVGIKESLAGREGKVIIDSVVMIVE